MFAEPTSVTQRSTTRVLSVQQPATELAQRDPGSEQPG